MLWPLIKGELKLDWCDDFLVSLTLLFFMTDQRHVALIPHDLQMLIAYLAYTTTS